MSSNFTLELTARDDTGTSASRRLRRAGQVPVVVYGADKDNACYTADHDRLMHNLEVQAFHSAIIDVNENKKRQSTILREVQMHPYKQQVLHIDLQRIKSTEAITLRVPLHFVGDDEAPGIKIDGGIFTRLIVDLEIQCLPKDLPEYIEIDVSALEMNQSVHISNITLPEGVELSSSYADADDYAVAGITPPRVAAAEEEAEEEPAAMDAQFEDAESES